MYPTYHLVWWFPLCISSLSHYCSVLSISVETNQGLKERSVHSYTATSARKRSLWYVIGMSESRIYYAKKLIFKWGLFFCLLKTGRIQSRWFSTKTRNPGPHLMKLKSRSASESYSESIWLFFIKCFQHDFLAKHKTRAIIRSAAFIKWH